jgi:hypothetical protein
MIMYLLVAFAAAAASSTPAPLSRQAQALIEPVHQAYEQVEADQARLPPPRTTSDKLERLYARDQAAREALVKIDVSVLPEDQRSAAWAAMWSEINAHDLTDQEALKSLIPADGWFKRSIYGDKAATAAFLIVQHAVNDPALMRQTLEKLGEYTSVGEAKGGQYALMYDRVALEFDQKPQRYGTQVSCVNGAWTPTNLEDPSDVDKRRKAVGLSESETDYLKHFVDRPCH